MTKDEKKEYDEINNYVETSQLDIIAEYIRKLLKKNEQLKKEIELWEDIHKHHLNIYHSLYDDYCKLKEELKDIKLGKPVPVKVEILKGMELSKPLENQLRKQVCDEIRSLAHNYFELVICDNCGNTIDDDCYISSSELCEILEKVEKGDI